MQLWPSYECQLRMSIRANEATLAENIDADADYSDTYADVMSFES